jgi:hypothetical protein
MEMEIQHSHTEVITVLEGVLLHIFRSLQGALMLSHSSMYSVHRLTRQHMCDFADKRYLFSQSDARARSRPSVLSILQNPSSSPSLARKSA